MTDLASRIAGLSPEKRALLEKRLGRGQTLPGPDGMDGAAVIAIIGMGCRFPGGADSPEAFWRMLAEGVDGVRETPPERWPDGTMEAWCARHPEARGLRWGGYLEHIDAFDPQFFGLSPREASRMDPQQRLLLEVAWETLERAGQPAGRLAGSRTGVFIGIHSQSSDYYWLQLGGPAGLDTYTSTGAAHSIMANRLSYQFDLRGPSVAVDTACSSSLVAVHLACQSLLTGESELALAGGVNLVLSPEASIAFSLLQFLSPDGRCKTFDSRANGFVRGEGCGVVALKRLADARRDGDPILAVIRGSATNQDGRSNGLTAPNGPAQQDVVRQACRRAGIEPASLGLIETHGTGTALGDPIEVEALAAVLGPGRGEGWPCRLGAVKSNLGHLEAAAGVAGLIKTVLCLQHRFIPPNLHLRELNPHLAPWAKLFRFPTQGEAWEEWGDTPRRAGVSSFGFGGANAHVVLEEAPGNAEYGMRNGGGLRGAEGGLPIAGKATGDAGCDEILILSARTPEALRALAAASEDCLGAPGMAECALRDIAYTAALRRTRHEYRLAVIGRSHEAWRAGLRAHAQGQRGRVAWDGAAESGWAVYVFSGEATEETEASLELMQSEPDFRQAPESDGRDVLLPKLGELHVRGLEVDWAQFFEGGGRCISLPAYPWQRIRCWLPESQAARGQGNPSQREPLAMLEADAPARHAVVELQAVASERPVPAVGDRTHPLREALLAASPAARPGLLSEYLAQQIGFLLGFDAAIDPQHPLHEYGIDSLCAMQLKNRLDTDWGIGVSISQLLEGHSVTALAEVILANWRPDTTGATRALATEAVGGQARSERGDAADQWEEGSL